MDRTERGEALPVAGTVQEICRGTDEPFTCGALEGVRWHVLWTRSHCERLVYDQLGAKGLELFLPEINVWSRRAGLRRLIRMPMFPGYLFLRHAMDKASYIEVCRARGLARVLGER